MQSKQSIFIQEPYRLFFPLGTIFLLCGILLWVPLIWTGDNYPVLVHRYFMLNGFTGSFIGGFLMTAVPKFSQTSSASKYEVWVYFLITMLGIIPAYGDRPVAVYLISSLQPLIILIFLFRRITKRKANPPYSFAFIFIGLFLWLISGVFCFFIDSEGFKQLHYEGAIACIILGVGSRLIPGILGHVDIVQTQRNIYEKPIPIFQSIPRHFLLLMASFIISYFLPQDIGGIVRALVVTAIGMIYWRLWKSPPTKTKLSWSIWISAWMIVLSFAFKVIWSDLGIHISHSFFINGIVLLSLLIATRVLQSHGPKKPELENKMVIGVVTFLIIFASATRVSAFIMPDLYFTHLAYSSIVLSLAVLLWGAKYLRYCCTQRN